MNRSVRRSSLLLALCVCTALVAGVAAVVPALSQDRSSAPSAGGLTTPGLATFITPAGSVAAACDGVDTCATGAITDIDAGDTLVVVVTEYTTSAGHPSLVEEVTSGGDNDLTLLGVTPCITGSGHGVTAIYGLADVAAQASVTFTVDYAADEYYTIHALDVEGAAAAPFETAGAGVCSAAAGTTGTATVTTTVANDLVILGVEVRASTAIAATGGDSLVTDAATTGAELDSGAMLDEIDADTGAISLSGTFTSASWSAIAVAIKPASSPLVSGVVSPTPATLDAGQNISLATTPATGGTPPITYQWYAATAASTCSSGALITGATSSTYTTPDLGVGTYYYCVWATDSSTPTPQVVYSNVATITVDPSLSVSVAPSAPAIDQGQSVDLTADVTGGTGPYTYAWYLGSACSGTVLATTQSFDSPTLAANTTYCVLVTDSAYAPETDTANTTITVSAAPLTATITPPAPTIDSGQSIDLTAEPSGGTGADTFAWYLGGTCSGTELATTQVYSTGPLDANATYCVAITDSAYLPVTAAANDTVTVSAVPLGVTISPNAPSIDSGQAIQLTANPSGGTGADTFAWYAGATCSGRVLATTQVYGTPDLTTTTTYCVAATDSATMPETAEATATVTVSAAPLSVAITPHSPSIDSGQTVQLTANPAGGTGTDAFAWYSGLTCVGTVLATTQSYTTPALTTTTAYCVTATDSAYSPATASANDTVTVSSAPLTVSISPDNPSIDLGQTVQLTANPAGGTGADSYAWYSGSACTGSVVSTARSYTTPALTVNSTYCVAATDSAYHPATATATDTVSVSSAPLTVTITPSSPSIDTGQTVQFTATPAGGVGADTFAWYSGGSCAGTVLATTQTYTTPALSASTQFCVAATDSASTPATATAVATVTVSASPLSVSITPKAPSVASGHTVQLTARPSGGTGADTFAWYSGSACTGAVLATTQVFTTPALSAATTYCVAATDSAQTPATATATATVSITIPSSSSSSPPVWEYPLIGVLAAILVAALLFLAWRPGRRTVTFIATGLPPTTTWSVALAGKPQSSADSRISFRVPKGTHEYRVERVAGYSTAQSTGAVTVDKGPVEVKIAFTV